MKRIPCILLLAAALMAAGSRLWGEGITVRVANVPEPDRPLIPMQSSWLYYKPLLAPVPGWQTNIDQVMVGWFTGNGGFGYGTGSPGTSLSDMRGSYSTFYLRKTFTTAAAVENFWRLKMRVAYDDGFVAYLDGIEVARANAPNLNGTEPNFNDVSTGFHEASQEVVFDLGTASAALPAGSHVLAIHALNHAVDDVDFFIDASLYLSDERSELLFTRVTTNQVDLAGMADFSGIQQVRVNGSNAVFNAADHSWSRTVSVEPGWNRLRIDAISTNGALLGFALKDILYDAGQTNISGALPPDAVWGPEMGIIRVTGQVTVPAQGKLTVLPGTVVLMDPGATLRCDNATFLVSASRVHPAYFYPSAGKGIWGGITASGTNALIQASFLETAGASISAQNGPVILLEDCGMKFFTNSAMVFTLGATSATLRRCHIAHYYEVNFKTTLTRIEDSLFEHVNGDGIDFDGPPLGSWVRGCTLREGDNTNIDAIDIGESADQTIIEYCDVRGFSDKGVSIGESSKGIVVRHNIFDTVETGVAVKDSCTAQMYNNLIVNSEYGFRLYEKTAGQGGGRATNTFNNILWANVVPIALSNNSVITVNYSDIQGTNYPGTGNLNVDPGFRNFGRRDYRLSASSPLRGTGWDGGDIGPIGLFGASWIDTDGDGMTDQWENAHGLDPLNPRDAIEDPDGDGFSNLAEFLAGTDPESRSSVFHIDHIEIAEEGRHVYFHAQAGRRYALEAAAELPASTWTRVGEPMTAPETGLVFLIDPDVAPQRFYRLVALESL